MQWEKEIGRESQFLLMFIWFESNRLQYSLSFSRLFFLFDWTLIYGLLLFLVFILPKAEIVSIEFGFTLLVGVFFFAVNFTKETPRQFISYVCFRLIIDQFICVVGFSFCHLLDLNLPNPFPKREFSRIDISAQCFVFLLFPRIDNPSN